MGKMPIYDENDDVIQIICLRRDIENVVTSAQNYIDLAQTIKGYIGYNAGIMHRENVASIRVIREIIEGDE